MTQIPLINMEPPVRLVPEKTEPIVWIRRLQIVRELRPGAEHVIRNVWLRRGLNIVWAPPQAPHTRGLSGTGIMGHTAGKTSFCRLVRYALGERQFANEGTRRHVQAKLPTAWLLAEVFVEGRQWSVARSLGYRARSFCIPDEGIERLTSDARHTGFTEFLDALAAVTTDRLPATRFAGDDETSITWDHLLPWLTRDQECRFADFDVWRHPASHSGAPSLTSDQRQLLVRSVLRLVTDEEREELQRNAMLLGRKSRRSNQLPSLVHQADVDEERLHHFLGNGASIGPGLFLASWHDDLTRRQEALRVRREELKRTDSRTDANSAVDRAVAVEAHATHDLEQLDRELEDRRASLQELDVQRRKEQQEALADTLKPDRYYCRRLMVEARAAGCPLAESVDTVFLTAHADRTLEEKRTAYAQAVSALEEQRAHLLARRDEASERLAAAKRARIRAYTEFDRLSGELADEESDLREYARLLANAERSRQEADAAGIEVVQLEAEIEQSRSRQERLRRTQREAYEYLSTIYQRIVRALLGDDVEARVESAGRSVELHILRNGERDSAAISTVKLLAFDLAALTASVLGQGHFPGFLVHDGPREADLAADVYERLFLYARKLEDSFVAEPGFQYIITTTTEPPPAVAKEPWVRLNLAGTQAEDRLYGMDF